MGWLLTGCAFFVGIHVVISGSPLRGAIWRWRRSSAHFSRRISLVLRIGSLSVAILASSSIGRGRLPGLG